MIVVQSESDSQLVHRALRLLEVKLRADGQPLPASIRTVVVWPQGDTISRERTTVDADAQPVHDPLVLPFDAVGRRLGISERTVRRQVSAGRLPAVSIGRRRFVRRSDLDAYIAGLGEQRDA